LILVEVLKSVSVGLELQLEIILVRFGISVSGLLLNLGKFILSLLNNCDGLFSDNVEFFLSCVDGFLKCKNFFLEFNDLNIDLVESVGVGGGVFQLFKC
jgi:hypothetical protein